MHEGWEVFYFPYASCFACIDHGSFKTQNWKAMTMKFSEFAKQFKFNPDKKLWVGVERECFLTNKEGTILPLAQSVLSHFKDETEFGYELSACQLETRIGPCRIQYVSRRIQSSEKKLNALENQLGFRRCHNEVAPENMPLDVYPDPTGRYQRITLNMPREVLLAACRAIGTHIHIGMPDFATALRVYNRALSYIPTLCRSGDNSSGRRLEIYKIMEPNCLPPYYNSLVEFYETALANKFDADPRRCWHLVRISIHGTIEFRMFGTTEKIDRVVEWARQCYELCKYGLTA